MRGTLEERFWAKVKKGAPDECWMWTAATDKDGYGLVRSKGTMKRAHHASVFLSTGSWPAYIMHSCDVRNCVNPSHLSEGNQNLNMKDCANKGRVFNTKLNAQKVVDIRCLLRAGVTHAKLAKRFGVARTAITKINLRETWKHVQ